MWLKQSIYTKLYCFYSTRLEGAAEKNIKELCEVSEGNFIDKHRRVSQYLVPSSCVYEMNHSNHVVTSYLEEHIDGSSLNHLPILDDRLEELHFPLMAR